MRSFDFETFTFFNSEEKEINTILVNLVIFILKFCSVEAPFFVAALSMCRGILLNYEVKTDR